MNKPDRIKQPYQNYYYRPTTPIGTAVKAPQPHIKRHRVRVFVVFLVIIALCVGISYGFTRSGKAIVKKYAKPVINLTKPQPVPAPTPSGLTPAALGTMTSAINAVISQNSDIDMSVSLVDLTNNQTEHYGDSNAFTAASTTKVLTAADFLHQVEIGQQSLNETIEDDTAGDEIQQMIVVSNDEDWNDIRNYLSFSQLQAYANSIGLESYQSTPNSVTSNDMALLLEKLYEGNLLNRSDTQLLLSYMKQANYREYIVPAVPSSDTIYHKTGFYIDNLNDEAIITNGQKAFAIVIFTDGNGEYDWPERAELMQTITKAALAAYF